MGAEHIDEFVTTPERGRAESAARDLAEPDPSAPAESTTESRQQSRIRRVCLVNVVSVVSSLAMVSGLAAVNIAIWTEHYGSGPPYFGRTVNLDKWTSPVSTMLLLNAGVLAIVALVAIVRRRVLRPPTVR